MNDREKSCYNRIRFADSHLLVSVDSVAIAKRIVKKKRLNTLNDNRIGD